MTAHQFKAFQESEHPELVGQMIYEDFPGEHPHWAGMVYPQTSTGVVYLLGWLNGYDKGSKP